MAKYWPASSWVFMMTKITGAHSTLCGRSPSIFPLLLSVTWTSAINAATNVLPDPMSACQKVRKESNGFEDGYLFQRESSSSIPNP